MKRIGVAGVFVALALAGLVIARSGSDEASAELTYGVATQYGAPVDAALGAASTAEAHEGFIYGRVATDDGAIYEGRLRWGGDEEALWSNYFNGFKDQNDWVEYASPEGLPKEGFSFELFGVGISFEKDLDLGRPLMVRFGDLERIEPQGRRILVTLKSGTVFDLDRFEADDLADGVRIWDESHGVVDVDEWQIRSIDFLPTPELGAVPAPLYGTVYTEHGDFSGLIQWNRRDALTSDQLSGHNAEEEVGLPFEAIRSIARGSRTSALVTLRNGEEMLLADSREVGESNLGIYVDDPRYGRVLVSWDALDRVEFSEGHAGPAYRDFTGGAPLMGAVGTRTGEQFAGRLVFDLDESLSNETLDAPAHGVDYTIPFGFISRIDPSSRDRGAVEVTLHSGEVLHLERSGDLGELSAGMLIFPGDGERPEYVAWEDVGEVVLDRPGS